MILLFLHIPKAGGSTFLSVLDKMYEADQIINVYNPSGDWDSAIANVEKLKKDEIKRISLVRGHFFYGIHKRLYGQSYKYITFLRAPIERMISLYYFIKESDQHYLYNDINKGLSFEDFISSNLSWELENCMVRQLTGKKDLNETLTDDDLFIAKQNIDNDFLFVGITEYYDESLVLLKDKLKWKDLPLYIKANVTKISKAFIGKEIREKIAKRNHYDVKLFQWALERFEQEKFSSLEFYDDLKIFAQSNASYQKGFSEGYTEGKAAGFGQGAKFYKDKIFKRYPVLKWLNYLKEIADF